MEQTQNPKIDSISQLESEIEGVKQKISQMREELTPPEPNPPLTVKIAAYLTIATGVGVSIFRCITIGWDEYISTFCGLLISCLIGLGLLRLDRSAWKFSVWGNVSALALVALIAILTGSGILPLPQKWTTSDTADVTICVTFASLQLFLLFTPSSRRAFKDWEAARKHPSAS